MKQIMFENQIEIATIEAFETEIQDGELTVIHFITYPCMDFIAHWWVNLNGEIFIRPVGTTDKLGLLYAHNIPVAPEKYFFKNKNEQLHFTLFFPALPKDTTHIDIIEQQGGSPNRFFNYYNIALSKINSAPLKH